MSPAPDPGPKRVPAPRVPVPSAPRPRVLVVDDNPIARKMVRAALAGDRVEVVEAPDARTALEAAARVPPALAIVDTALPDMDGFALSKALRALPSCAALPIVAVSASPSRLEEGRIRQGGFAARLSKPIELGAVRDAVRACLPSPAPVRGSGKGRTVLLVDAPSGRRDALAKRFDEAGFKVVAIDGAEEALDRARRAPPDAIVADAVLQGLDGLRLCVEMRKVESLSRLPIVLTSDVLTEEADRRLARRAGADALVEREEDPARVVESVLAILAHPPEGPAKGSSLSAEEYSRRLLTHVARQSAERAALERRLGRTEAREAVLLGLAEALRHTTHARLVLAELLGLACDAAGVSRGAAYLAGPDGRLTLDATFAVPDGARDALVDLYGHPWILRTVLGERRAISVPTSEAGPDSGGRLLDAAGVRSMLVTPLVAGDETLGVMVMASQHRDLGDEWVAFGRAMGYEMGQALALSRAAAWIASSEQQVRRLLESIPQGVYATDAEGRLTFSNRAAGTMLGIDPEALLGRKAHDTCHVSEGGESKGGPECAIDAPPGPLGRRGDGESMRRADGTTFPVEWTSFPLRVGGESAGTVVTFADLTERRAAERALLESEQRLRQSQKMEAVGRLASGVAHDFNNLLTAMTGYGDLLAGALADGGQRRFAEEILRAARRASALTGQLLAFSRKQVLKPVVLDVNAVAADMEPMLRRLLGARVELVTVFAKGLRPVRADPSQMEQVLLNLAVNARDAMPKGGRLTVSTANVDFEKTLVARPMEVPPGSWVRLTVEDDGVGMSPEIQERVFEPFFTTKAEGKGTGLGLATVHGIVEQSGGRLTLRSAPGAGAAFSVYLAAVDERVEAHATPAAPVAPPAGGSETVVVALDEEAVAGLVHRVLGDLGYATIEARDGADALSLSTRREPRVDLLLASSALGGIGGKDLAVRAVAARPGLKAVLVCDADEAADAAPFPCVVLPFTRDALARAVRETLDAR